MNIFHVRNGRATFTETASLVPEFSALLERDRDRASLEASYLNLAFSFDSPYAEYEPTRRLVVAWKSVFGEGKRKPGNDKLLKAAEAKVQEIQREGNMPYRFYEAAKDMAEKQIKFMRDLDLQEKDEKGKYINDQNKIKAMLLSSSDILANLEELRTKVMTRKYEKASTTKNRKVNKFER